MRRLGVALLAVSCGRLGFDAQTISLQLPEGGQLSQAAIAPDGTWYALSDESGVFRSDDHQSWTACAPAGGLAIGVADDGTLYMAGDTDVLSSTDRCASWQRTMLGANPQALGVAGTTVFCGTGSKLFELPAGGSWSQVQTPLDGSAYRAIAVNSASDLFVGGQTTGLAVKLHNSATFVAVTTGLATLSIGDFAVTPTKAYVITHSVNGTGGAISCASPPFSTWNQCDGAGGFAIAVDPGDANHVVAAVYDNIEATSDGFTTSTNGLRSPGMDAATVNDVRFVPGGGLLAVSDRGAFFSPDTHAIAWQDRNAGLSAWSISSIVRAGEDVYLSSEAGVLHAEIGAPFTLSTSGMTHNTKTYGLAVARDGTVISSGKEIRVSHDRGQTWQEVFDVLKADGYAANAIALDGDRAYAGTSAKIYSADPPYMTWTPHVVRGNGASVSVLLVAGGALWAGGSDGLFVSTDGATTFQAIAALATGTVTALAELPDGSIAVGTENGIWIGDATSGFTDVGLHPASVDDLRLDGTTIYAATRPGVLVSTDRGATWTTVPGSEQLVALALLVEPASLLVGTDGQGLVRVPKP
jgi:photosystem II stability/assembly factor-like uncharacterized protein